MGQQDWPDDRNIRQRSKIDLAQAGRFDPDIGLAQQCREAQTKKRERQTGGHLIGQRDLCEESKEQAEQRPANGRGHKSQYGRAGLYGGGKAKDRAGNHHALDAKVQNARFLGHQFADGGKDERGRGDKKACHKEDRVDCRKVHYAASVRPKRSR